MCYILPIKFDMEMVMKTCLMRSLLRVYELLSKKHLSQIPFKAVNNVNKGLATNNMVVDTSTSVLDYDEEMLYS